MTKKLATLIKFHKQQLDGLRRQAGEMERQREQLLRNAQAVREQLEREIELAGKTPELNQFFGGFAKAMQQREESLKAEAKNVEVRLHALQDRIHLAFQEVKKFEIAKEQQEEQEKQKLLRRENTMFDEVALTQYVRNKNSS